MADESLCYIGLFICPFVEAVLLERGECIQHSAFSPVGCELVKTDTYICHITHIPWSRYMESHLIEIVATDWLKTANHSIGLYKHSCIFL